MDIHVMVDAIAAVLAMEDKEFCKVGELAVAVMIETATIIMGDAYKVSNISTHWTCNENIVIKVVFQALV